MLFAIMMPTATPFCAMLPTATPFCENGLLLSHGLNNTAVYQAAHALADVLNQGQVHPLKCGNQHVRILEKVAECLVPLQHVWKGEGGSHSESASASVT